MNFLDELIARGDVNPAYKSSTRRVLSEVLGPGWEEADVSALDIETTLNLFSSKGPVAMPSLESYKSRFRRSMTMFREDGGTGRAALSSGQTLSGVLRTAAAGLEGAGLDRPISDDEARELVADIFKTARDGRRVSRRSR